MAVEPLVSIITVVFEAAHDLPQLIESVVRHKNDQMEFIVIDGGSTDGTQELLSQYGADIDVWVSEPDRGIYDAMNKGIGLARGTFVFHLNAGDRLLYVPLEELANAKAKQIDVLAFRVSVDGKYEFRPSCGIALRVKNTLHHQGTFYRRCSFPSYDIQYRIFADFDVNQRLVRDGARIMISDKVVAFHTGTGVSNVFTKSTVAEFFHIIHKNYGWTHLPLAWLAFKWRILCTRLSLLFRRFVPHKIRA